MRGGLTLGFALVHPEKIVFGPTKVLLQIFFIYLNHRISEMRRPIGAKFCPVVTVLGRSL